MEAVDHMSKHNASSLLYTRKDFWKQCVTDASAKIAEAKRRIKELERAREVFRKNAAEGTEIPGGGGRAATLQDATQSPSA
jgi:hypothetical protein